MKMNIFQIKIFNEITLLLFMIYSFIKFKVLVSLPNSFHGPLGMKMHCNWPTDHAIDHSSIGLRRLTIQLAFNEVSLFTFSEGTHSFDVTVPKNYLNLASLCFVGSRRHLWCCDARLSITNSHHQATNFAKFAKKVKCRKCLQRDETRETLYINQYFTGAFTVYLSMSLCLYHQQFKVFVHQSHNCQEHY